MTKPPYIPTTYAVRKVYVAAPIITESNRLSDADIAKNSEAFDRWFDELRCPSISPSDQRCIGIAEPWHEGHIDQHCSTWRDYAAKVRGRSGLGRTQ